MKGYLFFCIHFSHVRKLGTIIAEVGKAQEIYGSLSVKQSSNYEHVKEAILKAYELVPEAYRQKFRNYLKYDSKTHVEFMREKENLFNRWCHSKEVGKVETNGFTWRV